jgi:hypothetical protein
MEITPITADKLKPKKTRGPEDTGKRVFKDYEKAEELGQGSFASAFSSKKDPGTVRKVVSHVIDLEGDAYFSYIKLISKNNRMQSNRFFPRIFDIKVFKTPGDGDTTLYDYGIDMERLWDWNKLTDEDAYIAGKQLYHNFDRLMELDHIRGIPDSVSGRGLPKKRPYKRALLRLLRQTFSKHIKGKESKLIEIKDPQFKQAVMLIKGMQQKDRHGMFADIHDGNIMFRRTPQGVQLVLADPVAS